MSANQTLIKTLVFQLSIESNNENLLYEANVEARQVYNETIRLAKAGVDWGKISSRLEDEANLVKNTTQRVVAKALGAMENYREYDDFGLPSHTKDGPYPLRANYREGYTLSVTEGGDIAFRISAKPYKHVSGVLKGDDAHLDILETALTSDKWNLTTAEALWRNGTPELHVNVTHSEQTVRDPLESQIVVGIDVNEDNVALTALSTDGVEETLILEFPEIKLERHRYFTMRKRAQSADKSRIHKTLRGSEERFVRDRLHKVSRAIVTWIQRFDRPCIIFEDLKEMQASLDYGTRMNRRLHHLPFRTLQFYTSYKAAFEGTPTKHIDPEYTSQGCALTTCGHTERGNRRRKRFKCRSCGHQDHADRNASINIATKGVQKLGWNVPALNSLPQVRKVRRQASGAVNAPTVARDID